MNRKYKLTCALTVLTLALAGCAGKTIKVEEAKPNPLPKLAQAKSLVPVFSSSVSSTDEADPLRLRLDADNGVIFAINPNGEISAYQGKQLALIGRNFPIWINGKNHTVVCIEA
jgi:outer membrane protein assembly factor BamB